MQDFKRLQHDVQPANALEGAAGDGYIGGTCLDFHKVRSILQPQLLPTAAVVLFQLELVDSKNGVGLRIAGPGALVPGGQ